MLRIAITISLLFAAACGAITEAQYPNPVGYSGESWVDAALDGAAAFWYLHGIDISTGDQSGYAIKVMSLPPDRVGQCGHHTIVLSPTLAAEHREAVCILSHEIGHMLGMNHVVQSDSLMAPVVDYPRGAEGCFWSRYDEAEFRAAEDRGVSACP